MELLSIHLKSVHLETDDMRMERFSRTYESALTKRPSIKITQGKLFDCSECGIISENREEHNNHIQCVHNSGVTIVDNDVQEDEDNYEDESDEDELDYEMKEQPKDVEKEKRQSISFKSDSEEFNHGLEKLKKLLAKGAKYNFNGCKIKVKEDVIVGKTTTVEVTKDDLTGTAGIRFYSSKMSGNQVVISRQAKQKFALTEALALNIVKVLLDAHLNKSLTDEFFNQLKKTVQFKNHSKD